MISSSSRHVRATMLLLVLCLASNVVVVEGRMERMGKRQVLDLHRELRGRQVLGGPGDVGTQQPSAGAANGANGAAGADGNAAAASSPLVMETTSAQITSPTAQPVASSAAPNPLNPLTNFLPVTSSSSQEQANLVSSVVALTQTSSLSSILSPSSVTSISSSISSRTTSSAATSNKEDDPESVDVVNVYSTDLLSASLASASAAAASASASKKPEESSGLNKVSLIAIIAIGSSVALIAAVWTIFRKWKLSPSRQFEDKLTPIDWSPETAGAHRSEDKLVLTRSNSTGSGVSSMHKSPSAVGMNNNGMKRQNSWGSANGSNAGYGSRTDMAEIPYNNSALPAYPPANNAYVYNEQQNYQAARPTSPYEHLQRQPTGFSNNGGRYGESYNRQNY